MPTLPAHRHSDAVNAEALGKVVQHLKAEIT